jgi:hypothetical protein
MQFEDDLVFDYQQGILKPQSHTGCREEVGLGKAEGAFSTVIGNGNWFFNIWMSKLFSE